MTGIKEKVYFGFCKGNLGTAFRKELALQRAREDLLDMSNSLFKCPGVGWSTGELEKLREKHGAAP